MPTAPNVGIIFHDTKYIIGVMSLKRYRYRAYPKKGQKQPIAALFGCVRVVYNDALAYAEKSYKDTKKKPSHQELSARLTGLKRLLRSVGFLKFQPSLCSSLYAIWIRHTLTSSNQ